jgi:predicted PurR-regulated permease PerM
MLVFFTNVPHLAAMRLPAGCHLLADRHPQRWYSHSASWNRSGTVFAFPGIMNPSVQRAARYTLTIVGLYLTYLVLRPFLTALTWAVIFAILFHGMQSALAKRIGPTRAATATTLVVTMAIVVPVMFVVSALAREAPQVLDHLRLSSQDAPAQMQRFWEAVRARSPVPLPETANDVVTRLANRTVVFLNSQAGPLIAGSFATLGSLAAMLFALFFMLRDGDAMSRRLRDQLPFSGEDNGRLMDATHDMVTASVGAGLIVAAAQGTIGGLAFWLLGLGAPIFWGIVIAFCSLLPVVGAAIVWLPAGVALLLSGAVTRGVIMLLVGAFGISMVDNVLRPVLLSGKTSISGLVVFFGLLGGAAAFGMIGLLIGPIILVITEQILENLRRPETLTD